MLSGDNRLPSGPQNRFSAEEKEAKSGARVSKPLTLAHVNDIFNKKNQNFILIRKEIFSFILIRQKGVGDGDQGGN
jgi:hypothetical protein